MSLKQLRCFDKAVRADRYRTVGVKGIGFYLG